MKKTLLFAAVAALTFTFTACQEKQDLEVAQESSKEIAFTSVALTRGFVTGATFEDTAVAELHEGEPEVTKRVMWMSAYLTPQSGEPANYFVDEPYQYEAGDGKWHHSPKLYWPMSATLDFLAYSAGNRLTGTKCVWDENNAASKLILNVSEAQSQDDIVYAYNMANSTPNSDVALTFKHTQAWIEFDLKAEAADLITIKEIVLKDIYQKGEITIVAGGTPKDMTWNFASYRAGDVLVDDNYGVYDNALGITSSYLDMLIPAQSQTSILIKYVLAGQDTELEYNYDLPVSDWVEGNKYIYDITFKPQEIIVVPTVTVFGNGEEGASFPSELM